MEMSGQFHALAALLPEYQLVRSLGGVQSGLDFAKKRKILLLLDFEP
jgi:hypothetical protein